MQFINRLRVNLACQLLMRDEGMRIIEACYAAGFNNLSNFNRQFLRHKGVTPSRFRALFGDNRAFAAEEEEEVAIPA